MNLSDSWKFLFRVSQRGEWRSNDYIWKLVSGRFALIYQAVDTALLSLSFAAYAVYDGTDKTTRGNIRTMHSILDISRPNIRSTHCPILRAFVNQKYYVKTIIYFSSVSILQIYFIQIFMQITCDVYMI